MSITPGPGSQPDRDRPAHPTTKAYALIIGVVIAIVLLAAISTFGH